MRPRDNPFRSDRLQALAFRPQGADWAQLMERLRSLRYRAAIIGPEGSGKTTMLRDLQPRLNELGYTTHWIGVCRDQPRLTAGHRATLDTARGEMDIVLLDGADLLFRPTWWRVRHLTRHAGGVIVTSHGRHILPALMRTATSPSLLASLVNELTDGVDPREVHALFHDHRGNIRDGLRALYDRFATR